MNLRRPKGRLAGAPSSWLLALLAPLVSAPGAAAQDLAAPREHPILQAVERIRVDVARMRGLEYQADVRVGVKSPAQLRAMVLESFEKEAPVEEVQKQEKVFKRFGLIPADFDLRAKMIDFLSENIGGYYDPEKKELFLIDQSQGEGPQVPGAQAAMDEMVMAHELHHALQDQNFDLTRWFELLSSHDDRLQGYKSLVEGEAQLVGLQYLFKKMGRGDVDIAAFNRMQDMAMRMSPEAAKMRAIPPFLLENLMFPYTQGAEFVQRLHKERGWERIGAAFNDPPTSTEQILHPEKFFGPQRDEPKELLMPAFEAALGGDATELYENTLGEFNVSLLLRALGVSKANAAKAATGWGGDRFKSYETKDGRVVVIWLSTWDSEADAAKFEAAYRKVLPAGRHLERRGAEVLLVDGATDAERPALVRRGFASVKYEARYEPLPGLTSRPPREDFVRAEARRPAPAAAAAPAPGGLLHLDVVGATLRAPEGFERVPDPIGQLHQMGSEHFAGPGGARVRLLRLPIPLASAEEQLQALIAQGVPDAEVRSKEPARVLGRHGLWVDFVGTVPGERARSWGRVLVLDLGPDVVAIAATVPDGQDKASPQAVIEAIVAALWLDGSAGPGAKRTSFGQVRFEEPTGFVARPGQGPVVVTLDHPGGAKVQVVRGEAQGALHARAAALEAQLPLVLEDFRLRASGVVDRGGRATHELDFDAGGRRTRQATFDADGARWTVVCSAPADRFDDHLVAFGRVLATVGVTPAQPAAPRQEAPDAPRPERRAY